MAILAAQQNQVEPGSLAYHDLLDELSIFMARGGGKRLRPPFACWPTRVMAAASQKLLKIGGIAELLHAYLLIHDDIIDGDLQRWGGPNIEAVYQTHFKHQGLDKSTPTKRRNLGRFAGDICAALSLNVVAVSGPTGPRLQRSLGLPNKRCYEF